MDRRGLLALAAGAGGALIPTTVHADPPPTVVVPAGQELRIVAPLPIETEVLKLHDARLALIDTHLKVVDAHLALIDGRVLPGARWVS